MRSIFRAKIFACPVIIKFAILSPILLFGVTSTLPVLAQSKNLVIKAESIDSKKLPFPGKTLTLNAELSNTRDFRLPVRLLAVSDGKFHEVVAQPGLLGINDRPQYKVEIPAPIAELIYQFVLILPDGSAVSSQRVSVRRDCIPNLEPSEGKISDDVTGIERFNLLLVDNKKLEQEIDNLERAITEIDTLAELMSQ